MYTSSQRFLADRLRKSKGKSHNIPRIYLGKLYNIQGILDDVLNCWKMRWTDPIISKSARRKFDYKSSPYSRDCKGHHMKKRRNVHRKRTQQTSLVGTGSKTRKNPSLRWTLRFLSTSIDFYVKFTATKFGMVCVTLPILSKSNTRTRKFLSV